MFPIAALVRVRIRGLEKFDQQLLEAIFGKWPNSRFICITPVTGDLLNFNSVEGVDETVILYRERQSAEEAVRKSGIKTFPINRGQYDTRLLTLTLIEK